jgi:3-isopropylmalate/(R)-2-methylmalate dehydratase small subunit
MLTVVLNEEEVLELGRRARQIEGYQATVDLEECRITDATGFSAGFVVDEFQRHCLLNGLDDIAITLQYESEISAYESRVPPGV